ncbi:MAG TPA: SLATT domain-containing protein [Acidimicrobiales bacterium]|nr:SLATT domain-containing protein [Acidimicrobiales bacterium]
MRSAGTRGRAIAESIKTLAWRYAVGGDPFALSLGAHDADRLFLERVEEVVKKADQVQLAPVVGDQITGAMRELRRQPLDRRRESYCIGRVEDQMRWYAGKAQANGDSARRWGATAAASNVIGIVGSVARFFGWVDFDILGIAAAAAGSATAWVQLKQHRILATSYALASQELSLVRERLSAITDENSWSLEMSDAEDAISREHTMWLARHGHAA